MLVKVKLLTGTQTEIDIDSTDTIARIKERVEEKDGIDPRQQRLIFGGKQLADDKRADEYNIGALRGDGFSEESGCGGGGGGEGERAGRSSVGKEWGRRGGDRWWRLYWFRTLLAVRAHIWLMAAVAVVGVIHGHQAPGAAPRLPCVRQYSPRQLPTRPRGAAGCLCLVMQLTPLPVTICLSCWFERFAPLWTHLSLWSGPPQPSFPASPRSCRWLAR